MLSIPLQCSRIARTAASGGGVCGREGSFQGACRRGTGANEHQDHEKVLWRARGGGDRRLPGRDMRRLVADGGRGTGGRACPRHGAVDQRNPEVGRDPDGQQGNLEPGRSGGRDRVHICVRVDQRWDGSRDQQRQLHRRSSGYRQGHRRHRDRDRPHPGHRRQHPGTARISGSSAHSTGEHGRALDLRCRPAGADADRQHGNLEWDRPDHLHLSVDQRRRPGRDRQPELSRDTDRRWQADRRRYHRVQRRRRTGGTGEPPRRSAPPCPCRPPTRHHPRSRERRGRARS